nr:PREDICTED: glutamyl-tRNA(Gln) amidotransferase subunit C, mitochondrial isoform X1 [Linepithema humile]
MNTLRRIQQICRHFNKSAIISLQRCDTIPFFRTYASTVRARQPVENNCDDRPGNKKPVINETTIKRIEKLALVGFEYEQSKRVLEEAIAFAERLRTAHIDESVRPMYSTLENDHIRLRDDVVHHDVDRREILKNAAVLEEEYFVAPLTTDKSDSKQ